MSTSAGVPALAPIAVRRTALGWAAVAATLVAGVWIQWPDLFVYPVMSSLTIAVGVGFVTAGVLLWPEPVQHRNGLMFVAIGLTWLMADLRLRLDGPLPFIGWLVDPLPWALLAVLLLRYPAARSGRRLVRIYGAVLLGWVTAFHLAAGLAWDPDWAGRPEQIWWPTLVADQGLHRTLVETFWSGSAVLGITAAGLLIHRVWSSRGLDRQRLAPVVVAGAAVAVAVVAFAATRIGGPGAGEPSMVVDAVQALALLAILAVPGAFAVSALRARAARAAAAGKVLAAAPGPSDVAQIRDGLRAALADPALDVVVWLPDSGCYVDVDGAPASPDPAGRFAIPIAGHTGEPLAVLLGDPTLAGHGDVVDAAIDAARVALENARLRATLLAQLEELSRSRARLVTAGVAERRQVERDLHDGAQQRLFGLATTLGRVRNAAADPAATVRLVDEARAELRQALAELRDLARGIHPAVLEQAGLGPAVVSVAERLSLPVKVVVPPVRWPSTVESAAYFVASEALTNVAKHATANGATVRVREEDDQLIVEVEDDGTGGAVTASSGGLAGLTDRLAAIGGSLHIDSPTGKGTRVCARLPCG
jgi:signal transduction histidine kinase